MLVPYQGQRDQGTHSPCGQLGMLAAYKGKNNKRLAKLSHTEYELALTWKVQMQDKVNEGQRNKGDEDWWRNEREVFCGRISLLISRMHTIQVTDEKLLTCEAAECGNKESSSDESNDLEEASRSLCGSYKPPEVSQIHFNEKVDHLEILEDSVVTYNPQVQQKISTEVGFHASQGMPSLPPECSSQTKDEMAAQNYESHLYSVNMPLDKPERTADTMIQNLKICLQPPKDANRFNQKK
ncbi:hypothetical protein ACE6H2_010901 [Prunus campanulata]